MKNHRDCALLEKFLIFGRVLGMGLRFLKIGGLYPLVAGVHKNPKWPPLKREKVISQLPLVLNCCIM